MTPEANLKLPQVLSLNSYGKWMFPMFFCHKVDERRHIQSMFAGQKNIKRVLVLSST
jgi:hypothetical protein